MKNIKTVIFDYDGTLHNSTRIYADAFRLVYDRMVFDGVAPARTFADEEITKWLGYSAQDMWQEFMPEFLMLKNADITAKIGTSYLSEAQALFNLREDMADKSFDDVRKEAEDRWEAEGSAYGRAGTSFDQ